MGILHQVIDHPFSLNPVAINFRAQLQVLAHDMIFPSQSLPTQWK